MKVLLVAAATATTGGGERHVADLLRRLPKRGIAVAVACPKGGDLPALAATLGIPHFAAEIGGAYSWSGTARLREAIGSYGPDVVHAHGSRAAFYARRADPQAARRCVYTVHGIHADKAGSAPRRAVLLAIERWLRPRTALFVTVCEADMHKGARLGVLRSERTTTIYNGIEMPAGDAPHGAFRAELGVGADVPLALSIGRLHQQKDQATLLRAWALVHEQLPAAVLALVGSGPMEADLRTLASALALGESARFVAPRADLAPAYADADVFCLSSLWEGLPYVVTEAMSYGVPVVSTDVDGIPEAVEAGATGLLVAPGDATALAEALLDVLRDPVLADRMGETAVASVAARFGLDRMVTQTVAAYERVAGGGRTA